MILIIEKLYVHLHDLGQIKANVRFPALAHLLHDSMKLPLCNVKMLHLIFQQ